MPLYDYRCESCGHVFEKNLPMQHLEQPTKEPCPECGEVNVKKVILCGNMVVDPARLGRTKVSDGFNDVLKGIKAANKGSNIKIRK